MDEGLIIPEIPEPQNDGEPQKPTRDGPSGLGLKLDGRLVASDQTSEDIHKALAEMPSEPSNTPTDES